MGLPAFQRILGVRPTRSLGEALDFSRETQARRIEQGRADTADALDA